MIPGTGPGRGTPWWRQVTELIWRTDDHGQIDQPGKRQGRVIKTIPKKP